MRPHLCHVIPSFATGGTEVRTALLIDSSGDAFRHSIIALDGELCGRSLIRNREAVGFHAAPRGGNPLAAIRGLGRLLRSLGPDLILTYGWGGTDGLVAARLGGFGRLIHAEDGFLPDEASAQRPRRLLARRILLRTTARVVCPSHLLTRIARRSWWLPRGKVRYIPNGIDAARFSPGPPAARAASRRRLGIAEGELVIGTVGRLGAEKNHARLLRAFATVADRRPARLLIVGDGPRRDELERLAHTLGIGDRVLFAGMIADPVGHYRAMDLFALSSDTEQMPLAILEAMGVGLPIVSTDVGDVRGMLGPPNWRFVVPRGREEDYASALAGLGEDADARSRLGRANREECLRQHSQDAMIGAYLALYREVLGTGPRTRRMA